MRSSSSGRLTFLVSLVLACVAARPAPAQLLAPSEGPPAVLERAEVPASREAAVELRVARFGRYAITVSSTQGVALTLVRRMSGPGASDGVPGERDGRLDVLLERGRYLLRTRGDEHATGTATLAVTPYAEQNAEPLPELVPLRPVATTLGETGQRSWWLRVGEDGPPVVLEAAGRCLSDLRLWRDGVWLEPAEPEAGTVDPIAGRPLRVRRIVAALSPGLYLVTASGGPAEPWAAGGADEPLHLRLGIPPLPATDRRRLRIGPSGIDRWLVAPETDLVNVDLPAPTPLELAATVLDPDGLDTAVLDSAAIGPKTRVPSVSVATVSPGDVPVVVTVRGRAGQPYLLEALDTDTRFEAPSSSWVAAFRTGFPADRAPLTACILDRSGRPRAAQAVVVGPDRPWSGRFDAPGPVGIFLWIERAGRYALDPGNARAVARIEPFPTPSGRGYHTPRAESGRSSWDLDEGLAILTLYPEAPGILEPRLALVRADTAAPPAGGLPLLVPVRSGLGVQFPAFDASRGGPFTLVTGTIPGAVTGVLVRGRPVDIAGALPVLLEPGDRLEVPVTLATASLVRATTEEGDPVPLSADGEPPARDLRLGPGRHTLVLSGPPDHGVLASLEAVPVERLETTPLPPLPRAALDSRPRLPRLEPGAPPMPLEIARGGHADLLIEVDRAGFWIARSTGLLDTTGLLQDRTGAGRFEDDDSGPGYNFQIAAALESGVYGLRVATLGSSAGPCGVELVRNDPLDGGVVAPGRDGHLRLPAWRGARFTVRIPSAGRYRLEALSPSGTPSCRLEDAGGWPLERVGGPARFQRRFEAGELALVLLPAGGDRTVRVVLEPVEGPPSFEGHGPHRIPFGRTLRHTWREPASGGERTPDVWTFDLPVPVPVRIGLTGGVTGRLLGPGGSAVEGAERIAPGRPYEGTLPEGGTYRLEVRAAVPDDRLGYTVTVEPEPILPGMRREVALPATVTLGVPRGVVAIDTLGTVDTVAVLHGPDGSVLARSDDRPGDWNPGFVLPLDAGIHTLTVEPLGGAGGTVRIALDLCATRAHPAIHPPDHLVVPADGSVHVVPVDVPRGHVLLASASGPGSLTLALERRHGGRWRTVARRAGRAPSLEVATGPDPVRLRVWPTVPADGSLDLSVASAEPRTVSLGDGPRVLRTAPPVRGAFRTGLALVELGGPGVLVLENPLPGLCATDRRGAPLEPVEGVLVPSATGTLWIATPSPVTTEVRRLALGGGTVSVPVPVGRTVTLDLEPAQGPSVVEATSTAGTVLLAAEPGGFPSCRPAASGTVLVLGPDAARLLVRLGEAGTGGTVTVTRRPFSPAARPFRGPVDRTVVPPEGLVLELPGGPAGWSLATGPGVAAAFSSPRDGLVTVSAAHDAAATATAGAFDALFLLPAGGEPAAATLRLLPPDGLPAGVSPDRPAARPASAPAIVRLHVDGTASGVLAVAGARDAPLVVTPDGRALSGPAVPAPPEGSALWFEAGPGPAVAWFGPAASPASALVEASARTVPCAPPCRVAADGAALAVALENAAATVVTVTVPPGCAARLDGPAGRTAWVQSGDDPRHVPLPPGGAVLAVRSLLPGLPAEVRVTTAPVVEAGEGLGDPVALGPGEAVCFRFEVPRKTDVGIGVAARPDTVQAVLLDGEGRPAGEGIVQLRTLGPGPWLLLVRQDGPGAATVRPALAGLVPPPSGPPEETVRHYLELSGRIR